MSRSSSPDSSPNVSQNTSPKSKIKDDDKMEFDPFNPKNTEITLNEVQSILKSYGVYADIHNLELYKRAFVHRSYVKKPDAENDEANIIIAQKPYDCIPLKTKSNERLEFLGDGVLELITKYYLYRRFPKADEGFMTCLLYTSPSPRD